jgi:hypothetical protein
MNDNEYEALVRQMTYVTSAINHAPVTEGRDLINEFFAGLGTIARQELADCVDGWLAKDAAGLEDAKWRAGV